jgi:hypothetical protein
MSTFQQDLQYYQTLFDSYQNQIQLAIQASETIHNTLGAPDTLTNGFLQNDEDYNRSMIMYNDYQQQLRRLTQCSNSIHKIMTRIMMQKTIAEHREHRTRNRQTSTPIRTNENVFFYERMRTMLERPPPEQPPQTIPTRNQIERATNQLRYGDIPVPISTQCVISWTDFTENDMVTQIIGCGHLFQPESINQWFQRNSRCPVCRYDICTFLSENNGSDDSDSDSDDPEELLERNDNLRMDEISNFFTSIFNPNNDQINYRRLYFDPSGNTLTFDAEFGRTRNS